MTTFSPGDQVYHRGMQKTGTYLGDHTWQGRDRATYRRTPYGGWHWDITPTEGTSHVLFDGADEALAVSTDQLERA